MDNIDRPSNDENEGCFMHRRTVRCIMSQLKEW